MSRIFLSSMKTIFFGSLFDVSLCRLRDECRDDRERRGPPEVDPLLVGLDPLPDPLLLGGFSLSSLSSSLILS